MQTEDDPLASRPKDMAPYMLLSLFLLLLAFFILLNALASVENTRSQAVLTSLAATFRTVTEPENTAEIYVSSLGPTPAPEEIVGEMERLWVTQIAVTKVEVLTDGLAMQLTMPVNELYIGGEAAVRADRRQLLGNVATTLSVQAEGYVSELQFTLGDRLGEAGRPPEGMSLPMQRTAQFAAELEAYGAPPATVAVGLRGGDPDVVRLRFAIRPANTLGIDFHQLVPTP